MRPVLARPCLRLATAAVAGCALAVGAAGSASAQLLLIETHVPGQPEVSGAHFAAAADALDDLKGVKVVTPAAMKAAIATATPALHLLEAPRLKILGDKVTAAYALAGGADPARAIELAKEAAPQLLLATVAGAEAETRAVFFGAMAAMAEAARNLGRTAEAVAALRDAIMYASEYEVTPDVYPAPLVDLYNRARSELAASKGSIEVNASDPDAEITIDGISAGRATFAGDLPRGEHYAYAKAGRASSAMMKFTVGTARSALHLEVVDPDLVKFGPNPYVDFASLSDRTLREPSLAATLLRRGGATGVAFISFDGTSIEIRVYDGDAKLTGSGAIKKSGGFGDLAARLAPTIPRTAKAMASGGTPAGTGDKGTGLSDPGDGTTRPPKGSGGGGLRTPLMITSGVAAGAGLIFTIAFAALGAATEAEVRDRLVFPGFYDYDSRVSMRRLGRTYNAIAVLGLLVAIAGGTGAVVAAVSKPRGEKKAVKPAGTSRLSFRIAPDGDLAVEF